MICNESWIDTYPTKVFLPRRTLKPMVTSFLWETFHIKTMILERQKILHGTQAFVCQKFLEKKRQQSEDEESFSTMIMQARTHQLKQLIIWPVKKYRNYGLTWHPMTSLITELTNLQFSKAYYSKNECNLRPNVFQVPKCSIFTKKKRNPEICIFQQI